MKKFLYYVLVGIFAGGFSLLMTFLIFATQLGSILSYLVFIPIIESLTDGMGESSMGIALYTSLILNFIYGLFLFFGIIILIRKLKNSNSH